MKVVIKTKILTFFTIQFLILVTSTVTNSVYGFFVIWYNLSTYNLTLLFKKMIYKSTVKVLVGGICCKKKIFKHLKIVYKKSTVKTFE